MSKIIPDSSSFNKIVVWLPTYRNSVIGEIREDGRAENFGVKDVLLNRFDEVERCLKRNNYLLIVKPHPMDEICTMKLPESINIRIVSNNDLSDKCFQLYEFLADCDVLLTDYSSVFIDFLVTGKPMAFICGDINEYGENRGFCFEPPQDYMPGELICNMDQFIEYLDHMETINKEWREKYKEIQSLFNPLCDDQASKRVCDSIWGKN